ncbi:MAG: cysteine synthase CysM [Spirochaetales bacterium]
MKAIHVVCALLEDDGKLLLARRSPGQALAGLWEFPGGKVEEGESPRDALARELREELGTEVNLGESLGFSVVESAGRLIVLEGFEGRLSRPLGTLSVHDAVEWREPRSVERARLASADHLLLDRWLERRPTYPDVLGLIGNTPLVRLTKLGTGLNTVLLKLEGNNPAGSVKDRPALSMIQEAAKQGRIRPGDTLIEATSGNTGIGLAMASAALGYQMVVIMPENASLERRQAMAALGARLILTPKEGGMEASIDLARSMETAGEGVILDQFGNPDNPLAHYRTTGPELWRDTRGTLTHFVASTGTTGTLMGVSRYLKEQNPKITIVGAVPAEGAHIPGIRKWPEAYLPAIYEPTRLDRTLAVPQSEAEALTRRLARTEGLLVGTSSGGNVWTALQLDLELSGAVIVAVVCDRGDRYFSTGVFDA